MSRFEIRRELRAWRKRRSRRSRENGARSLAAIERTGLVFIHIPKTGGKTVIRNLYGLETHAYFGHATAAFYEALLGPRAYSRMRSFAVVRDPVARTRSAFQFGRKGGFGFEPDLRVRERIAGMEWSEFLVSGLLEEFSTEYPIFRPQISFLRGRGGALSCDVLLRTEHLSADLATLTGGAIPPASIEVVNRGNYAEHVREATVAEQERRLVAEVYREDIDLIKGRLVPFLDGPTDEVPAVLPSGAGRSSAPTSASPPQASPR